MFTVRTTGDVELDRVQADVKTSFDDAQSLIVLVQAQAQIIAASRPMQPSGVTPGTYTIASITSITVDVYGRIVAIT